MDALRRSWQYLPMPPLIWPPDSDFKSGGERELEVLQKVLTEKDPLLANVRFTERGGATFEQVPISFF